MSYRRGSAYDFATYSGGDVRDFPPPEPPSCQEEADRIAAALARDAAEREERCAVRLVENRAANRAACLYRHDRSIARAAATLNMAMAVARRDGFDIPHRAEISELMSRTIAGVRAQQSQTMEGDA